jgi:hypothetical protein
MYLTEKEVREKICQQTLAGDPEQNGNCEGSRCMAWRWGEPPDMERGNDRVPRPDRRGFCGLAGMPEVE